MHIDFNTQNDAMPMPNGDDMQVQNQLVQIVVWSIKSLVYTCKCYPFTVNSVSWAPHEFGLMLACGSSDSSISVVSSSGDGQWDAKKINNAHTVSSNIQFLSKNVIMPCITYKSPLIFLYLIKFCSIIPLCQK